ncbi:c-type cytochrome [Paraburkholderia ferrariae]|uniref:c-type cytochrome n=1 Tax=Paraburkholderia ferrariae TaxID=386056 RepID=UPI0005A72855|nr:c-type cytochrome [Paraburkholderia ferrariae]
MPRRRIAAVFVRPRLPGGFLPARTTSLRTVAALLFAVQATGVLAQLPEPTELVDQQHCMFCHTLDAPFLAPSFHQIADRYRTVPNASAMLEEKLVHGGKAHWGDMAMPLPEDRGGPLSPKDAQTLVQWVLSQ